VVHGICSAASTSAGARAQPIAISAPRSCPWRWLAAPSLRHTSAGRSDRHPGWCQCR
jgi:hypothetical protein